MEIQKGFAVTNLKTEDVISNLESCCICGTRLRFTHKTDYLKMEVQEEATCPACGIKNKVASFILQ